MRADAVPHVTDAGYLAGLCGAAAAIGFVHTLAGPDHYVPFIAMARVGRWSLARTACITALCGVGHVLGSVAIGAAGIALGATLTPLVGIESMRGELAAWLLLGFGLAYTAWGIRHAIRNRPHSHLHVHADGTVHAHAHAHIGEHAHVHAPPVTPARHAAADADVGTSPPGRHVSRMTPWVLFTIFVFGPCEPLIPVLMFPALSGGVWGVSLVALSFAAATVATMLALVVAGYLGLGRLPLRLGERYVHVLGGAALTVCGLAMTLGL